MKRALLAKSDISRYTPGRSVVLLWSPRSGASVACDDRRLFDSGGARHGVLKQVRVKWGVMIEVIPPRGSGGFDLASQSSVPWASWTIFRLASATTTPTAFWSISTGARRALGPEAQARSSPLPRTAAPVLAWRRAHVECPMSKRRHGRDSLLG